MYRTLTLRLVDRQRLAYLLVYAFAHTVCVPAADMCTCTCCLLTKLACFTCTQAGCDHRAVLCRISARLWIRCKLRVTWPHAVTCFMEAHGFWLWHLILGSSGNTSVGPLAVTCHHCAADWEIYWLTVIHLDLSCQTRQQQCHKQSGGPGLWDRETVDEKEGLSAAENRKNTNKRWKAKRDGMLDRIMSDWEGDKHKQREWLEKRTLPKKI